MLAGGRVVSTGRRLSRGGVGVLLRVGGVASQLDRCSFVDSRRFSSTSTGDTAQFKTEYDAVVIGAGLMLLLDQTYRLAVRKDAWHLLTQSVKGIFLSYRLDYTVAWQFIVKCKFAEYFILLFCGRITYCTPNEWKTLDKTSIDWKMAWVTNEGEGGKVKIAESRNAETWNLWQTSNLVQAWGHNASPSILTVRVLVVSDHA